MDKIVCSLALVLCCYACLTVAEEGRDRRQFFDSLGGMALGDKRSVYAPFDSLGGISLGKKSALWSIPYYSNAKVREYLRLLKGMDEKRIIDSLAGDMIVKRAE